MKKEQIFCDFCRKKIDVERKYVTVISLDEEELHFCDIEHMLNFYKDDETEE